MNETIGGIVEEIVKRVRRECNSYPIPNAAGEKLQLVREIDDAHNREMAAKDAQINELEHKLSKQREINFELVNENSRPLHENYKLRHELRIAKKAKEEDIKYEYEYAILIKSSRTWDIALSGIYSLDDAMNMISFFKLKNLVQERRIVRRTVGAWEVVE